VVLVVVGERGRKMRKVMRMMLKVKKRMES
jgi:flagellar biosynthesis/type III secretory pathway ATPase